MLPTFKDWNRHFNDLDLLFGWAGARPAPRPAVSGPRFNLEETEAAWHLHGLLPGWSADQVELTVEDGSLLLRGQHPADLPEGYRPLRRERGEQRFARSLRLSDDVDVDNISAQFRNGVLTVRLPRKAPPQPRRIAVAVA